MDPRSIYFKGSLKNSNTYSGLRSTDFSKKPVHDSKATKQNKVNIIKHKEKNIQNGHTKWNATKF